MLDHKKHLQVIIDKTQRRLYILRGKKAQMGISTPPEIIVEIEDLETELVNLRKKLEQEFAPLLQLLSDDDDNVRVQAAEELGQSNEPTVIPWLAERLLREENPNVSYYLAGAIGNIGGNEARKTLIKLRVQLANADPFTLMGLEDALNKLKSFQ